MYVLTNAIKNIGRNKGRNILFGIILFVIILTTAVSIIINNTTAAIIDDYKSKFGAEVYIYLDSDKMMGVTDPKPITSQEYLKFGESNILQKKIFIGTHSLVMTNIKGVGEDNMGGVETDNTAPGGQTASKLVRPNALMMGYSSKDINDEFNQGIREIIEGKMATGAGEVIISQKLAELNDLKIGSSISIGKYSRTGITDEDIVVVSGIYRDNLPEQNTIGAMTNRSNELITTLDIFTDMKINALDSVGEQGVNIRASYFLKNPDQLEAFQKELTDKGLPDYYKVRANDNAYKRIVEPVEGMKNITTIFMFVVLGLGSVILILLSTMSIRERKYEIGVLRAMGMKKGKVAKGLLFEMITITSICLGLGLGLGAVAAPPIADTLMSKQIAVSEEKHQGEGWGDIDEKDRNPLSEAKINLTSKAVVEISLIALLLAGVSSAAGIIFITKYEPMKILSERD